MESNKKLILAASLAAAAIVLLVFPWGSTVAPAIRVQVLDADGNPAKNVIVRQQWGHYNLGSDGEEYARTDDNGYVSFPERSVRANLPSRVVRAIAGIFTGAGVGPRGSIWAHGEGRHEWVSHEHWAGHPAPEQFRLKRWGADIYPGGEREATNPAPNNRSQPTPR